MDDTLYKNLIDSIQVLENMSVLLSDISNEIKKINDSSKELSKNPISSIMGDIAYIVSIVNSLKMLCNNLNNVAKAGNIAAGMFSGLTEIILNVSPYLLLATAVVGVVTAIGSLITGTDEAADKTDKYVEKLNKKREALRENTKEMKKNFEAMVNNANSIQNDYSFTLRQVDELVKLTGEGGYATNLEKAKYLVKQINDVLPDSVKITEDGKIAWKDNTKTVQENAEAVKASIKELERRAVLESYEKEAAEALRNRAKYQAELTAAEEAHQKAVNAVAAAEDRYRKAKEGDGINARKYKEELDDANKKLREQEKVLYDTQSQFAQNEKIINTCRYAYESLDGNIETTARLHAEMYTEIGNRGTSSWSSLTKAIKELDIQEQEYLDNGLDRSSEEIQINTRTTELIREQCFAKADAYGYSFDRMISELEKKGVILTELEREEWEKQYNNHKQNIKNKEEIQRLGFENMIAQLVESSELFDEKEQEILNREILNWAGNAKSKEEIQALNMETLISNLEAAGVQLNETQKNLLREGCEDWKAKAVEKEEAFDASISTINRYLLDGLTNMNSETSSKAIELINILKDGGIEGGLELCQKLAKSLEDNGGKVTDETMEIIEQILALVNNNKPVSQINVVGQTAETVKDVVKRMQDNIGNLELPIWLKPVSKSFEILGNYINLTFGNACADGGFVDTGELFIAREAGPELVGRINGKTAVANNDQIVSGISSGVYNAMVSAMSRSHRANTTVTAIFQVDGKQVAKQVINAHNREVMQTGRSPLLI